MALSENHLHSSQVDAGSAAVDEDVRAGEEVVAVALGVRQRAYYAVLRISIGGERWSNRSSGRLVLDKAIAALHEDGVRQFDLGPGHDEFKRRFGAAKVELAAVTEPLNLRGAALARLTKWVSGYPRPGRGLPTRRASYTPRHGQS